MPDAADYTTRAWAAMWHSKKGPRPSRHLCWDGTNDPAPRVFWTKRDCAAWIEKSFWFLRVPERNREGHPMPRAVRVDVTISVVPRTRRDG